MSGDALDLDKPTVGTRVTVSRTDVIGQTRLDPDGWKITVGHGWFSADEISDDDHAAAVREVEELRAVVARVRALGSSLAADSVHSSATQRVLHLVGDDILQALGATQ